MASDLLCFDGLCESGCTDIADCIDAQIHRIQQLALGDGLCDGRCTSIADVIVA